MVVDLETLDYDSKSLARDWSMNSSNGQADSVFWQGIRVRNRTASQKVCGRQSLRRSAAGAD